MSDLVTITVGGINPAEIELEGSSVVTISGGSTKIDIIEIDPAEIKIEGVSAVSVSGSSVELILDSPAEIEIEGGGTFTIGAEITVSPAEIEIEGVAPLVSHLVSVLPADVEIEGVLAVSVSGSSCELVLETPADVEIKGIVPIVGYVLIPSPASISVDGTPAQYVRNISAFELFLMTMPANYPAVTLYRCYLTGSPDLYLPISSFQARARNGDPSYLEVVVPNALKYIDEISDRASSEIVVEKGLQYPSGTSYYIELLRVDFEAMPYDFGAKNQTIRLSGHKTTTNESPKTTALNSVSVVSMQADGKRRIRAAVDFLARPGDTVTWNDGDDSMVVGFITLTVSVLQQIMDITEA